ncbi:MAG: Fic family protein [Oscillospiraceae bacterium]|nr:Fic family protein [Oscillospiraceae bacterium]
MDEIQIWKPIEFNPVWLEVDTSRLDEILPTWLQQRESFSENDAVYAAFLEQVKRKHALETGMLEGLYALDRGTTETLIKDGFVADYIAHERSTMPKHELMSYLTCQLQALEMIFALVKQDRPLSVSFIKQLHQLLTQSQSHTEAIDQFENRHSILLLKGEFKRQENYPVRNGKRFLYCPVLQTAAEMDKLIEVYHSLDDVNPVVKAAWLHHAFSIIHPFQDGNGRVARLLASLVLIQANLFPLTIDSTNRERYIDALEQADNGTYRALVDLFIDDQFDNIYDIKLAISQKLLASKMEFRSAILTLLKRTLFTHETNLTKILPHTATISRNAVKKHQTNEYAQNLKIEFEHSSFRIQFTLTEKAFYSELLCEPESIYLTLSRKKTLFVCDFERLNDSNYEKIVQDFMQKSIAEALDRIQRLI